MPPVWTPESGVPGYHFVILLDQYNMHDILPYNLDGSDSRKIYIDFLYTKISQIVALRRAA